MDVTRDEVSPAATSVPAVSHFRSGTFNIPLHTNSLQRKQMTSNSQEQADEEFARLLQQEEFLQDQTVGDYQNPNETSTNTANTQQNKPSNKLKPLKKQQFSKTGVNLQTLQNMGNYLGGAADDAKQDENNPNPSNNASNTNTNQKVNNGKPDQLLQMLGNTFVTNDGMGDKTFAKAIAPNAVIGLYFSAQWCGPCRQFTANFLKPSYAEWKRQNKKIEIVFVSGDRDYNSFKEYFNNHHGPWLAIPYGTPQIQALKMQFQVRGIPKLVFIDSYGNVVDANGRQLVQSQGGGAADTLLKNLPEPAPVFKEFSGTAFSLKDESSANGGDEISIYDYIPAKAVTVDESKETATMQIVTADGKKVALKMNTTQTVGDLFGHVKSYVII